MKCAGAFATTFALTACAASQTTPTALPAAHEPANTASEAPLNVVEVDLRSPGATDSVVCRKKAATGTRIAINYCDSTAPESSAETVARNRMLEDIEEMRSRQWQLEQAQQQALRGTLIPRGVPAPQP